MSDASLPPLEVREGVGIHRPSPGRTLHDAAADVVVAIEAACALRLPFLLLDGRDLALASPSLADRAAISRRWAAAANGRLQLVIVLPAALIDPEHFGVVTAAKHGLSGQVFDDLDDAWEWIAAFAREDRTGAEPAGPTL